jgi:cobalamin biosynthesis Co2+ chelatase CbiK
MSDGYTHVVVLSLHTIPGEEFHELYQNAQLFGQMAGDEPDSWKSVLTRNGYQCEPILKGSADYPEIVEVWLNHLRIVLAHF